MSSNLTKSPAFRAALRAGRGMRAAWAAARSARRSNPGRRRGKRSSNPLLRLPNPSFAKVASTVKSAVSVENAKKGAAVAATVAAGWLLPARFLPQHDTGFKGAGLTLAAGVVASAVIGAVSPSLAGIALAAAFGGTVLKLGLGKAREALGLNGFLTLNGAGGRVGQLPAGLIAGAGRVGDFLETKRPVVALGPRGLGGGERFSRTY